MSLKNPVRKGMLEAGLAIAGLLACRQTLPAAPQIPNSNRSAASAVSEGTEVPKPRIVAQREPIPYTTRRKASNQLRSGASRTVRPGVNGVRETTYRIHTQSEEAVSHREFVTTRILRQPVTEIVEVGQRGVLPSRGYFSGRHVVSMVATYYDPYHCGGSGTGRTATGIKAGYGVAAVDPRFIPLGTRLYVEGYGYAVAADTGGAIKGNRIDLAIDTKHDARRIRGISGRKAVRVHILD